MWQQLRPLAAAAAAASAPAVFALAQPRPQWCRELEEERVCGECQLLRKETLCESRGEPVRRFTFAVPAGKHMNVETALRQAIVVPAPGLGLRTYSPTSEPNRADGTFELVLRVYKDGQVSRWFDSIPVGGRVPMIWPWPAPLSSYQRNPGRRVGLIAYGIGITELYRVAARELRDPSVDEVALLYATRTVEEQQVLSRELEELSASHPGRFRVERTLTRERVVGFRTGHVDAAMLNEVFPWADHERHNVRFLPAGTESMMEDAMAMLDSLGYRRKTYRLLVDQVLAGMVPGSLFSMMRAMGNRLLE